MRKGKRRLLAYVLGGLGISIGALAIILFQSQLPVYRAEGIIEEVHVHAEGRGFRSNLRIRSADGTELVINASGRSSYFRFGQRVRVSYEGYRGSILKAEFISSSGGKEAVFNGTDYVPPYFFLLGGLVIIWAGIKKHKRNPDGLEQPTARNSKLHTGVDNSSLLHLSDSSKIKTR